MENLEPYVFVKKIQGEDLYIQEFINSLLCIPNSPISLAKEGFFDTYIDKKVLHTNYCSIQSEHELIYDENNSEITEKHLKKIVKAEITIMLDSKIAIIWGSPSLIKKIERQIEKSSNLKLTLKSIRIDYKKCLKSLQVQDFVIRKISFNNLKLLGSNVKSITMEVLNNNSAYNIIENIGTDVSKFNVDVLLKNDEKLTLKINLKAGIIKTEFRILSKTNIEISKELVDKLCLDGGEYSV